MSENHRTKTVSLQATSNPRKKAAKAFKEADSAYRTIFDLSSDGILVGRFSGRLNGNKFTDANQKICEMLGYTREEFLNLSLPDLHPKESLSHIIPQAEKIINNEISVARNIPVLRKDKSLFFADISCRTINLNGKKHLVAIFKDITEHIKSEALLKESEERYHLLADHMKDYIWLMDLDLKVTYVSPSAEKIMGYSQDEIAQFSKDKFLTPASFRAAMDFLAEEMPKALNGLPDYVLNRTLELEFCTKNGQTIWGEVSFSFIRDRNGKPVSILAEGRNITKRKEIEYELRASEENFRLSLDNSPLGVRISTIEGETIYANRAILDIYGYASVEELRKSSVQERYTPKSFAEFQERKQKRLKGEPGPSEYEISIVRKDGEIRHLHVFRKEIFWNGEKQSQVIYQDITERRKTEEKLNELLHTLRQSVKTTIQVLSLATEVRDPYTAGHQKRVAHLARSIAREKGLPHEMIDGIRMAGVIHDIGKLSVPSEILAKPTQLTQLEFSLIQEHSRAGYEMLKDVESPWPLAEILYQHHERMNGTGYPRNLKGNEILIEARVLAVADVVEAMASHRPYRPGFGIEAALEEIEQNKGILYDETVVDACLKLFREKGYQLV
ncbi:MAG: PAS domain S-box protein [Smithella sp.]|nr:PAS domain S-box protein [Smithella sp.]MDM7987801.1 PAS domain S-box protein [Smithella sp.]HOU50957.1 PAS domain S-box protein [Smithella sp.]HQG65140.1 PAS domain S-box protein [Smithella sp.]HQH16337.1 PAS domain S-box protein [Smithella sp.]